MKLANYYRRTVEKTLDRMNKTFPVVLITGPRQVGKTTILKKCSSKKRKYVSLDIQENRLLAKENPDLFLQRFSPPLLIDEIQYAPELLSYIKNIVDQSQEKGLFWLTGSQQFHLMKGVSESLAGRVSIIQMQGFSLSESKEKLNNLKFLPTNDWILNKEKIGTNLSYEDLFRLIWRGSFPAMHSTPELDWEDFYSSYLKTYIERDIRDLTSIGDEMFFLKFLISVASRTGQLLNYSDIARDIGKPMVTVQRWVSLLVTSGIVYLLYPYAQNIGNRMTKMPKIYFLDTGLACYLTKWNSWEALEAGAKSGEMLETFVVSEILKSYWHNGRTPNISFYRDKEKREIDLIFEENGLLYPVEIKKKTNPNKDDIKYFPILEKTGFNVGNGAVICPSQDYKPIQKNVNIIPIRFL